MQHERNQRRAYGSGGLWQENGNWYGKFRVHGRQVKKRLGPVRKPGTRDGLTKTQAEAALARLKTETTAPPVTDRLSVEDAGARLVAHRKAMGRKRATVEALESHLRVHLVPFFGATAVDRIQPRDVEAFRDAKLAAGCAPKSVCNYLGTLHSLFDFAQRRGWCSTNPCKLVDKPSAQDTDADIRFLDEAELAALLDAVATDAWGRVEHVMYLTAALTGLRQGELLALRWLDVDWTARRIRVRRNWVRGEFGTPKSKRSSRSVPLADSLGGELDRLYKDSPYQMDDDLVFGHPETGKPLDRSKVLKRYKAALKRAGLRPVRFHDLRHTFGTHTVAVGVPLRTVQEWMGHRDFKTTLIYADYMPSEREADLVDLAFRGTNPSTNLSSTEANSDQVEPLSEAAHDPSR